MWRVRKYIEKGFRHGKRWKLDHVVECTAAVTGVSPTIACKLKTAKDIGDWKYENDENITVNGRVKYWKTTP